MLFGFLGRKSPWKPALPEGMRAYAIGDIHGRLDLLRTLLDMIRADDAERGMADTHIVLLGDLVDRGADSAGVIECAMQPLDFATLTVLQGNHEAMMLEGLSGNWDALQAWLRFGGRETLTSWGVPDDIFDELPDRIAEAALARIPEDQRAWLAERPLSFELGDYYFVHAGVRPGVPLHRQSDHDRLWIREPFLKSTTRHPAMIVHGHSVTQDVAMLPNRIGIDTGAYASDKLTALGLEGTEQWLLQTG